MHDHEDDSHLLLECPTAKRAFWLCLCQHPDSQQVQAHKLPQLILYPQAETIQTGQAQAKGKSFPGVRQQLSQEQLLRTLRAWQFESAPIPL